MRKYRVFISSTISNLRNEREGLRRVIEELGYEAVMAELFDASAHAADKVCAREVAESTVMILLLGDSYGFVTKYGISATETEFNIARNFGKPVLVYRAAGELMPASMPKEIAERYSAFLKRIEDYELGYFRDTFVNVFDLQEKAKKAIVVTIAERIDATSETRSAELLWTAGLSVQQLGYRRLSPPVCAAVENALVLAASAGHEFLGIPHLLAALADVPDGLLRDFLKRNGRTSEQLRDLISQLVRPTEADSQSIRAPLAITNGWEAAFRSASDHAKRQHMLDIADRHVLLAIFDVRPQLMNELATALGMRFDVLRQEALARVSTPYTFSSRDGFDRPSGSDP